MKAVLNETKRILAVMLSVAMIIAAVPQVAFAAPESPSENDAIQTEEDGVANEAVDTVAEEPTEEPSEEGNAKDLPLNDTVTRILKAEYADPNTPTIATVTPEKGETVTLDYGQTYTPVTITAKADLNADGDTTDEGEGKYTDAKFTFYKFVDGKHLADITTPAGNTLEQANAAAAANEAILDDEAVVTLPDGFNFEGKDSGGILTISGTPKEIGTFEYIVKITDEENTGNPALYIGLKFVVNKLADVVKVRPSTVGTAAETATNPYVVGEHDFGSAKMGYTIDVGTNKVSSHDIVIDSEAGDGATIEDLTFKLTDAQGSQAEVEAGTINKGTVVDWFDLSYSPASKALDKTSPVTVTVAPKPGLVKGTGKDVNGTYTAWLHISSKKALATTDEKVVKLVFTVENNIAMTATFESNDVAIGTLEEVEEIAAGGHYSEEFDGPIYKADGTYITDTPKADGGYENTGAQPLKVFAKRGETAAYPVELGTKKVGSTFDDVVIRATGGAADLEVFPDETYGVPALTAAGLEGIGGYDDDEATLTISGKMKAANLTPVVFRVTAADTLNNSESLWFKIDRAAADAITFDIDGTEIKAGANTYSWSAGADTELDDAYAVLTVSNNSSVDITVKGTLTNSTEYKTDSSKFESTDGLEVKAGQSAKIKITPLKNGSSNLAITATGLADRSVTLQFTKSAQKLEIMSPSAGADTIIPITTAELGKSYSYKFKAVAADGLCPPEYFILSPDEYETLVGLEGTSWINSTDMTTALTALGSEGDKASVASEEELYAWFGLELNEETGELSGTMEPGIDPETDPQVIYTNNNHGSVDTPANYYFVIVAGASSNARNYYYSKLVKLETVKPKDALLATSNGTTVLGGTSPTKKIDLGSITIANETGESATVAVKNNTKLGVKGLKAEITSLAHKKAGATDYTTTNTPADIVKYFTITPNDGTNKEKTKALTEVKAGETVNFTITSAKPAESTDLTAGSYKAEVTLTGTNLNAATPYVFTVYLTVKDATVIAGNNLNGFKTGTEVTAADNKGFTASLASAPTLQYTFAWDEDAAPAGLTLSTDGKITGTPTAAGIYKVPVTATGKQDTTVTATKTFEINVAGSYTLTALTAGTTVLNNDKETYVLNGLISGKAAVSEQIEFIATKGVTEDTSAEGVKVEIEDAEDDRTDPDSIAKSPTNPYVGSTSVINVSRTTIGAIEAGKKGYFDITTDKDAPAGEYKIKVTISGTNATARVFYVYLVVVNEFKFSESSISSEFMVGEPKLLALRTEGGMKGQTISFGEFQKKATEKTDGVTKGNSLNYVTIRKTAETDKTEVLQNTLGAGGPGATQPISGLYLMQNTETTLGDLEGTHAGEEWVATIGSSTYDTEGAATRKGNYNVKIQAMVAGKSINAADHKGTFENVGPTNIPEQKATETIALSVKGSNNVSITKVQGDNLDPEYPGLWYKQPGIQGTPLGETNWDPITGYVMKNSAVGYDETTKDLVVTLQSLAQTPITYTASLVGGAESPFKIVGAVADPTDEDYLKRPNVVVAASEDGAILGAVNEEIVIEPQKDLAIKDTAYTDTLLITSDNADTIELALSFTVEAKTWLTEVEYVTNATETHGVDDHVVAENNTKTADIVLTGLVAEETPVALEKGYIRNTGNSEITNLQIYEINSSGAKVTGSSAKVTIGTPSSTTLGINAGVDDEASFTIAPAQNEEGEYTATVQVSFKESATSTTTIKYPLTVKYVVYNKAVTGVTVTPSTTTALTTASEGYTPQSTEFTIKNETSGGATKGLFGAVAEFSDETSETNFVMTSSEDGATVANTGDSIVFDPIAAGNGTTKFTVTPEKGLPAGNYTANIKITAGNLSAPFMRKITFKVEESQSYKVDVYPQVSRADVTAINTLSPGRISNTVAKSFAQRLFESVVVGMRTDNTYVDDITATTNQTTVALDLDNSGITPSDVDATIVFTGSTGANLATGANVDSAVIYTVNKLDMQSATITLTAEEKKRCTDDLGSTTSKAYFTDITINPFSVVTFNTAGAGVYTREKAKDLSNNNVFVPDASIAFSNPLDPLLIDEKPYAGQVGSYAGAVPFYAIVPNATVAAKVFTAQTLPTVVTEGKANEGWMYGSNVITDNSTVDGCGAYTPSWHNHKYPVSFDETVDKQNPYIKWTWTGDATNGYTAASVTITCTENCPDADKGAVTKKATMGKKTAKADCIHGERTEYVATVTYLGNTYTSTRATNEGQPLGHKYNTTITWEEQADHSYAPKIVQTCSVCEETMTGHTFTVTNITQATPEVKKQATCTENGEVIYTITSFVDGNGKTVTGDDVKAIANYTYDALIKALGHDWDHAEIEVLTKDETGKPLTAKITCPRCHQVVYNGAVVAALDEDGNYKLTFADGEGIERTVTYVTDILYNPVITLSAFPTKWLKSSGKYPEITYTGTVQSKSNNGATKTISGTAVVTSDPATISENALEATFTARVDLSKYFADAEGKTKAEGVSQSITYRFAGGGDEGISDIYYDTKVTWVDKFPAKWDKSTALPTVTYKISYKAASNPSKNEVTAPIKATVTRQDVSSNKVILTAKTDLAGYFIDKEGKKPAKDETLEQTYTFKKDSPSGNAAGEGGEDGKTESEPEESSVPGYKSYNLFYTGQEIEVPGLSAALGTSTSLGTKADQYYKVSGTDTVVVSVTEVKKIKKAANASNSLISFTGSDGEVFAYQLPVYYQKPTLKLTKTSASIRPKTDGDTTVTTTVTQKKSTKLFEPLDITKQKEGKDYWTAGKGTAPKVALGEEDGELAITANAKGSGKIHIELENWAEGIDLSYSVKEVKKDTLTASAKTVYMNTNAESGDDQEVKIFLNGEEFSGKDAGITLKDWPKNWSSANVDVDGINEDKTVEGSTITFKYKGAPVKGNYSFKFVSKDNKAVTVKLSVSNKTLDKAVSLSVKTKADIVTGQKMVVVPTLKYVGGPIEDITLEGTDADKFELDNWNAATNQIIIVPSPDKAPTDYNTKTKYNLTVNVEAGGITCPIALKNFKVSATKPSVKIAAVTMKVDGSAEGYTNLVATYKQGGKTFSIEPTSVAITSNAAGGEVTYDPDEGQFHIDKPTKAGKVKVAVTFADGKAQNKSFSIKKAK